MDSKPALEECACVRACLQRTEVLASLTWEKNTRDCHDGAFVKLRGLWQWYIYSRLSQGGN